MDYHVDMSVMSFRKQFVAHVNTTTHISLDRNTREEVAWRDESNKGGDQVLTPPSPFGSGGGSRYRCVPISNIRSRGLRTDLTTAPSGGKYVSDAASIGIYALRVRQRLEFI